MPYSVKEAPSRKGNRVHEFVLVVNLPTADDEQTGFLAALRRRIPDDDVVQHGDILEVWWEQESQHADQARMHVEQYVRQACGEAGIDFEDVGVRIKETNPQE
jgi:hypothetical protein